MKNVALSNFVEKRIQENAILFTAEELKYIRNHKKCIEKIYLLGFIDSKECYKEHN